MVSAQLLRFNAHTPRASLPRKLYNYRRFDVFCLRALAHAEVSYFDPRTFNDPLDCDPTIEVDIDREALEHLCYVFLRRTQFEDRAKDEIMLPSRLVRDTYFFVKAGPWRYEREWREVEEKSGIRQFGFA